MNGIHTALELRKAGYDGPIILRSSESRDTLNKQYPEFENLMKSGVFNFYVNKTCVMHLKEAIQHCFGNNK